MNNMYCESEANIAKETDLRKKKSNNLFYYKLQQVLTSSSRDYCKSLLRKMHFSPTSPVFPQTRIKVRFQSMWLIGNVLNRRKNRTHLRCYFSVHVLGEQIPWRLMFLHFLSQNETQ